MELEAVFPVAGRADAVIQPGQFPLQIGSELLVMGGHHRHHRGKAL